MFGVATSLVSFNIVQCTEALVAGAVGDVAVMRLLVFLFVLS